LLEEQNIVIAQRRERAEKAESLCSDQAKKIEALRRALRWYSSDAYRQRNPDALFDTTPLYHWSLHKKKGGWMHYPCGNNKPWEVADAALAQSEAVEGTEPRAPEKRK
jgi:hypothetical protein